MPLNADLICEDGIANMNHLVPNIAEFGNGSGWRSFPHEETRRVGRLPQPASSTMATTGKWSL